MPVTRMRMRPWLEKMIESNDVPGLSWVDKEKTMFSIPWKHAARHGWELAKDASLFKLWAIHTGKYVEGQTCDPKTWKANFHCAMNSLPDVEEVKDESINKGHQAMRVFRLLPSTPKSRDKRSKAEQTKTMKKGSIVKIEEEDSDMDESNPEDTSSTQENTVDSAVNTEEEDFSFVAPSEVPRFDVSPEHSPDFDETDHIIQICQQLEKDSHWMTSCSLDGTGFLSNEACSSPGSDWTDSSSDFSFVAPSEVPRFEVSPEHSPDFDETDHIIQICQQLEKDSHWMTSCSLDGTGFLSNEACSSPGGQWSDSSSVDELDEMPQYHTLGSDPTKDEFWNNFCQQLPPFH